MHTVTVEHAKAHLDELLDEAVHSEEVAISVGDDVVVRWTVERKPHASEGISSDLPQFGMLTSKDWMPPDFNLVPAGSAENQSEASTGWPMLGLYEGQGWMAADFNEIPEGFKEYVK